ncbi:hypothetical protein BDA99DRAFT_523575 [Phascolomyces articulosus]|uniref:NmrA-like domain-containing protein n=1 Tax=Phascolomyces articulosus TaxID=60185 RepID=A0AAD5JR59_9FUNG|nr:hypothetical protein BDA99DRAFT_523575 [Phascolomyces articulosus]
MTDKVFIVGGTGHIGERCVQQLLNNNVPVTLYTRSPSKVQAKFPQVAMVEGDYNDFTPLERGIQGHARLFLLVADLAGMPKIKETIATLAYRAGVKQIVDISSLAVTLPWRSTFLGNTHRLAEEAIHAIPQRSGTYVALRPTMFMTNHLWIDVQTIKKEGVLRHTADVDELEGFISNHDIADLAANVLQDSIEKHGDATYELTGCALTPRQRVAALEKVAGRKVEYVQISPKERYEKLIGMGMPHVMAMDLVSLFKGVNTVSLGLPIVLGREPESFEQWLEHYKDVFQ